MNYAKLTPALTLVFHIMPVVCHKRRYHFAIFSAFYALIQGLDLLQVGLGISLGIIIQMYSALAMSYKIALNIITQNIGLIPLISLVLYSFL